MKANHWSSVWHTVLPGAERDFPASVAISSVTYPTDAQTVRTPGGPLRNLHM